MQRILYFYLLTLLTLTACGEKKTAETETTEVGSEHVIVSQTQFETNGMTLGRLEEKLFPETISASGMIDVPPENRATISAVMGGYIKRTPLLVGDAVKKGQLLVTLENPEFVKLQQEYLEVKERLDYLKSEYERQKILFDEKISSQKNYLKTESDYKTANARYNGLRKQLGLLNISPSEVEKGNITTTVSLYAPIPGSITNVFVSKGAYVSPASPVIEIVDNEHIHLELSVFEKDIMSIEKGQPIFFEVPEVTDEIFEAEVFLVGTAIDENRTIKVHGHLKNEEQRFLTGMFVEANIVTDSETVMALPSEAVVQTDNNTHILRLISKGNNGYRFETVKIETGNSHDGFTKIVDYGALGADDLFLVKGAFGLLDTQGGGHDH